MPEKIPPFFVRKDIHVKPYDVDVLGHVSNIVYIRWLEDLRLTMLDTYLPLRGLMEKNVSPVLVRTEIDYIKPVELFDPLVGTCHITEVKGIRLHVAEEFSVNGEIRARAKQTGIFFDLAGQRPVRPPEEFMKKYREFSGA